MVKISKTKHVTKQGVVKKNPKRRSWSSLPDPNIPEGVGYMEDELDEEGNWTGGYSIEGFDYYNARLDIMRIIRQQLSKMGIFQVKEAKKLQYGLDIDITFIKDGQEYRLVGIKHIYAVDADEPITGLWNWTMMGYQKPDEKIIKKKLVGADV